MSTTSMIMRIERELQALMPIIQNTVKVRFGPYDLYVGHAGIHGGDFRDLILAAPDYKAALCSGWPDIQVSVARQINRQREVK